MRILYWMVFDEAPAVDFLTASVKITFAVYPLCMYGIDSTSGER